MRYALISGEAQPSASTAENNPVDPAADIIADKELALRPLR